MSVAEAFGFAVRKEEHWEGDGCPDDEHPTDRWSVFLPHQCSSWGVAGAENGLGDAVPHAYAVEALERFIAEAQSALVKLRAREETE